MSSDRERALVELAASQYGHFSLSQALDLGFPERTIRSRTGSGRLRGVHPGVYAIGGGVRTWRGDVMAAVLAGQGVVAASHATAAHLWGLLTTRPGTVEVTMTRHLRLHPREHVVHESLDLEPGDVAVVDGIPTTSVARTIVDLGASRPPWVVESCLDAALRNRRVTLGEVRSFIERVARSGRTGVGVARPILERRERWMTVTDSELESTFLAMVDDASLPLPATQYQLRDERGRFVGRFDFAYPEHRVLIELDSERWHRDLASFHRDREKQNRAHALGWTVYRFTWRQLKEDRRRVLTILASVAA